MASRMVTFRIPEDLYVEFQRQCENDRVTVSERLRKFIDDLVYPPTKPQAEPNRAAVMEEAKGKRPEVLTVSGLQDGLMQLAKVMVSVLERIKRVEKAVGISSGEKKGKLGWPLDIFFE